MAKKKKVRRTSVGLRALSIPPATKLSAGKKRLEDKAKAEKEHPELVLLFNHIKAGLKEHLATGRRFEYRKSTEKMYRLIWEWDEEEFLDANQTAIARLRGVPQRAKANRFNGIVAICSDADRKTVSRWSQELDTAFEAEVQPKLLISFLEKEAASKTEKSKAKKAKAKKAKVKKPKAKKYYWGPKPA